MAVFTVSITDGTTLANLAVAAGRGPKGDGFTGGSFNASTGVVTFTSNDGLGFATSDLRSDLSEPSPIGDVTPNTGAFTSLSTTGNTVIGGNLTVNGTTTTVNSQTLDVVDKNITIAFGSVDAAAANGAGLTVDGADATLTYVSAGDKWVFNKPVDVTGNIALTGTVDGRDVASDGSKLDGIEALADVTDTANVTAAGALMDSELTNITAVKTLNQGVATTDSPSFAGLTATTADINGGTIDGTVIGGSTPAAISGTTGQFGTSLNVDGTVTADGLTVDANEININATSVALSRGINFNGNGGSSSINVEGSFNQGISVKLDKNDLSTFGYFEVVDGSAERNLFVVEDNGDISFFEDTGTTPKFYWDASGERLGLGTSIPTKKLTLAVGNNDGITFGDRAQSGSFGIGLTGAGSFLGNTCSILFDMTGTGTGSVVYRNHNGSHIFQNGDTERARIDASGILLVGKTATNANTVGCELLPIGVLHAARDGNVAAVFGRNISDGALVIFRRSGTQVGSISVTTTTTAYNTSSDYRLKEDVQPMVGASDRVLSLKPCNFAWKVDGSRVDGFIAHEAQAVVPEAVTGEKDAVDKDGKPVYQAIDQSKLTPLLTAALQEALQKIDALEARITALEA